jgi:Transposase IS66 family
MHSRTIQSRLPPVARYSVGTVAQTGQSHVAGRRSLLGKALHYISSQCSKLIRYIKDVNFTIDNNAYENAVRPF